MLLAKLKSEVNKKEVIFIGLSELNLERLKKGKSIIIKGKDLQIDQDILIAYGKKEKDIQNEFDFPLIN